MDIEDLQTFIFNICIHSHLLPPFAVGGSALSPNAATAFSVASRPTDVREDESVRSVGVGRSTRTNCHVLSCHKLAFARLYVCVCSDVPTTPEPQTGQPLRKRLGDLSTNVDIVPCPAPRALPAVGVENRLPQSESLSAVVCLCLCALFYARI